MRLFLHLNKNKKCNTKLGHAKKIYSNVTPPFMTKTNGTNDSEYWFINCHARQIKEINSVKRFLQASRGQVS